MALNRWEREIVHSYIQHWTRIDVGALPAQLRSVHRKWSGVVGMQRVCAVCLVVADLLDQDWLVRVRAGQLYAVPAEERTDKVYDGQEHKARLRRSLRIGRDRQLREPSVRGFLNSMEKGRKKSVLHLIDDGNELANDITAAMSRGDNLTSLIDPEIVICDRGASDDVTGLAYLDIWRYFRHTWTLEYRPTPGRTLPIIVRNRARPNRPVIGIALLASPVMRLHQRDDWFGWSQSAFLSRLRDPNVEPRFWQGEISAILDGALANIRYDDLISEGSFHEPTDDDVMLLERLASGANAKRKRLLEEIEAGEEATYLSRGAVKEARDDTDWKTASLDPLFVKKRAELLAQLLNARRQVARAASFDVDRDALLAFYSDGEGRQALSLIAREHLKSIVSTDLMDVAICGAIQPYGELLGGKLVTLLLTSSEVQTAYRERYANQAGIIASQMAGRPILKKSELRFLTTSSLYGNVGSSQYNRLKLRKSDHPELVDDVVWSEIGKTQGFGSVHLSARTVESLREASVEFHGARRINSRFGEGTNPRMRQIREGLETLGMAGDQVLAHATPRLLYGCRLPRNHSAADLTAAWVRRWLVGRLERFDPRERLRGLGPQSVADELVREEDGQYVLPLEQTFPRRRTSSGGP
jgi:hypothetical protein